jgi:hypothetical protein
MAMDEEAGGLDIELLADVLTDFDQILAALAASTRVRFMPVFNARQMLGERLATRAFASGRLAGRAQLLGFSRLRTGVGTPAFLEQLALFCGELFALVGEANALVVPQFKGQRLDLERIIPGLFEKLADPGRQGGIGAELGKFGS